MRKLLMILMLGFLTLPFNAKAFDSVAKDALGNLELNGYNMLSLHESNAIFSSNGKKQDEGLWVSFKADQFKIIQLGFVFHPKTYNQDKNKFVEGLASDIEVVMKQIDTSKMKDWLAGIDKVMAQHQKVLIKNIDKLSAKNSVVKFKLGKLNCEASGDDTQVILTIKN